MIRTEPLSREFQLNAGQDREEEILVTELPKTKVATTIHVGSQEKSEEAYKALHIWMQENNAKEAGAPWEVYLAESKMEIYFPIQ